MDAVSFTGTTPTFQSLSEWSIDVAAGTWTVGPGNNFALNPSFEADRVAMTPGRLDDQHFCGGTKITSPADTRAAGRGSSPWPPLRQL